MSGGGWPFHFDPVFSRLEGVRLNGKGWKACCPAHKDDHPSLGLWLQDGRLAMNCLAKGCALADILGSLGLHMSAVFPPEKRLEPGSREHLEFVEAYPYRDAYGLLWFEHVRWRRGPDSSSPGSKTFSFRRPNPGYDSRRPKGEANRQWIPNKDDCPRLLYRLPELNQALVEKPGRPVFLLEGEKAVDYCRGRGLVATCSEAGAGPGKFLAGHAEQLRGQNVLVIPDEDVPEAVPGDGLSGGLEHAVGCCLCLYGIAASVKLVRLPECQPKWGLDDWLAWQAEQGRPLLLRLAALTQEAPEWHPSMEDYPPAFAELYCEMRRLEQGGQDSMAERAGIALARLNALQPLLLEALEGRTLRGQLHPLIMKLAAAVLSMAR